MKTRQADVQNIIFTEYLENELEPSKKCVIQQRYVLAFMAFLALFNAFAMRANLTIAITRMVLPANISAIDKSDKSMVINVDISVCPIDSDAEDELANEHLTNASVNDAIDIIANGHDLFDWSQELQGIILSSFYWGYVISHLPGGLLAQKFGGKYVLGFSIFLSGLLNMLIPVCVRFGGAHSLIAIRVLMGISQGPIFPACLSLFSSWIPLKERSTILSVAYGGILVGTIAGTFVSGLLIHHLGTWHAAFYFFGVLSIVWFLCYVILCYSYPQDHPFICNNEKLYLHKELGQLERDKDQTPTPWRDMLTSKPVLALIFTQAAQDWGYFVISTDLPKYMNDVLHVSVQNNGIYSSIPHLVAMFLSFFVGYLSDWIIAGNYLNVTNTRKLFVFLPSMIAAVFIMGASYAGCNKTIVILFFTITVTSQNLATPGSYVNPMDLSPNYIGPLSAIVNGVSAFSGILSPYVIGLMTPNSLLSEWRTIFWLTFCIYMAAITVYCTWGSGKTQPWNSSTFCRSEWNVQNSWICGCEPKTRNTVLKITIFITVNVIFLLLITYI